MVVVHRAFGLRFVIYTNDHRPAHVHVIGRGEAKVEIAGPDDRPVLMHVTGMTQADQRRILREIAEHRNALLARWSDIHG